MDTNGHFIFKLFSKRGSIKSQIGQSEIFRNWRWTPVFSIWGTFSNRRKGLLYIYISYYIILYYIIYIHIISYYILIYYIYIYVCVREYVLSFLASELTHTLHLRKKPKASKAHHLWSPFADVSWQIFGKKNTHLSLLISFLISFRCPQYN